MSQAEDVVTRGVDETNAAGRQFDALCEQY